MMVTFVDQRPVLVPDPPERLTHERAMDPPSPLRRREETDLADNGSNRDLEEKETILRRARRSQSIQAEDELQGGCNYFVKSCLAPFSILPTLFPFFYEDDESSLIGSER